MLDLRNMSYRFRTTALTATAFVAFIGCSGDDLGKRYPVKGTVTYNGQSLSKGSVTFLPDDSAGRGATGEIKNGSYSMMTQTPGDGVFPGSYSVTVSDPTVDFSAAEEETKKKLEKLNLAPSAIPDQVSVAKAYTSAKQGVPAKYGQIATSGLKFTVKPESNTFNIELKD
jgi:hypothetical protein